jgi:hypothetical protein
LSRFRVRSHDIRIGIFILKGLTMCDSLILECLVGHH